jgi:hypothetical protein
LFPQAVAADSQHRLGRRSKGGERESFELHST